MKRLGKAIHAGVAACVTTVRIDDQAPRAGITLVPNSSMDRCHLLVAQTAEAEHTDQAVRARGFDHPRAFLMTVSGPPMTSRFPTRQAASRLNLQENRGSAR